MSHYQKRKRYLISNYLVNKHKPNCTFARCKFKYSNERLGKNEKKTKKPI